MRRNAAPLPPLHLAWLAASLLVAAAGAARAEGAATAEFATGRASAHECSTRLDAAVLLAEDGDATGAERELERLAARCEHWPQIDHDLGVLAARDGRLPEAIAAFEASLAKDPRAAMTLSHLRALHRHEAATAYARVLGTGTAVRPPELALQDSSDVNAESLRAPVGDAEPRTLVALEQTLFDWWLSARARGTDAWLAHYDDVYPEALALAGRPRIADLSWESTRREIAFTAEDAVAVIGHDDGALAERRRLLLRLRGNRWKIYRETPL